MARMTSRNYGRLILTVIVIIFAAISAVERNTPAHVIFGVSAIVMGIRTLISYWVGE